ncbi:hypothetical protein BS50DRAFT_593093 [Corynespora cassiicola Philippines]|uniref:Uncharacterized protein n=1 Tax=Corynespora cassiicola Philippines TaxID=1448308 RepID=A0A2T2N6U1_CORCC|nr:hypothetical protein BS50DRAFT_593093 [Corynespora cassiicola Philippines]
MADTARSLTFQNVRTALTKCDTPEMNKLIDLLTTGRIYPRNDAMLATSRGKFGNLATDIPQVLNMSQLPWGFLPTLKQIKDILKQSLVINDDVRLTPSANLVKSDPQVIKQVVNAIENPEFAGNGGSIYGLACEELNQMWTNPKLGMQWQAAVEKSAFECDIMPRGTHQELDFNNIHDVSILLSGLRVWVVFPPIKRNLSLMKRFLANKIADTYPTLGCIAHAARAFEGGLVFVQNQGETVTVPPYCARIIVSCEMSVSTNYHVATADKLSLRLQNLDMFPIQYKWVAEDEYPKEVSAFLTFLHNDMSKSFGFLRARNPPQFLTPYMNNLITDWDSSILQIKFLCDQAGGIEWPKTWGYLFAEYTLAGNRKHNFLCLLCDHSFTFTKHHKNEDKMGPLKDHFVEAHWADTKTNAENDVDPDAEANFEGAETPQGMGHMSLKRPLLLMKLSDSEPEINIEADSKAVEVSQAMDQMSLKRPMRLMKLSDLEPEPEAKRIKFVAKGPNKHFWQ